MRFELSVSHLKAIFVWAWFFRSLTWPEIYTMVVLFLSQDDGDIRCDVKTSITQILNWSYFCCEQGKLNADNMLLAF